MIIEPKLHRLDRFQHPRMLEEVAAHREAIEQEGSPRIQATWEAIEEHIDLFYHELKRLDAIITKEQTEAFTPSK